MKTVEIDDGFGGTIEVPLRDIIIITLLPPILVLVFGIVTKYIWSEL